MAAVPFNDLARQHRTCAPALEVAVQRVLRSGWYSLGPEVEAFEAELAAFVGVGHAVGVASGTDALGLALAALGCGPGDEVLTAANAGGYTSAAAYSLGASPRYVDVDPDTLLIDPDSVVAGLTQRTKAVVATHLYGRMAPVRALQRICAAAGVVLVEDCAQSIGAKVDADLAGSFGAVSAFSFYPTKNLGGAGDGGAVCTSDHTIAQRVRSLRQYGWGQRYTVELGGGRNSRLDELQAAVLRVKLPLVDGWNRRRREIAARYRTAFPADSGRMIGSDGPDDVAHLAVAVTSDRSAMAAMLSAQGISTAIHYPVADHRQPAYRDRGPSRNSLPVTDRVTAGVLSLPCFPELTHAEVESVVRALALGHGHEIGQRERG